MVMLYVERQILIWTLFQGFTYTLRLERRRRRRHSKPLRSPLVLRTLPTWPCAVPPTAILGALTYCLAEHLPNSTTYLR